MRTFSASRSCRASRASKIAEDAAARVLPGRLSRAVFITVEEFPRDWRQEGDRLAPFGFCVMLP
jgi:hypothetical protein